MFKEAYRRASNFYQGIKPARALQYIEIIERVVRVGDVIVLRSEFTERLTPGYWSHAGIYVGAAQGKRREVVEARGYGVHAIPLKKYVRANNVAVLRPHAPYEDRLRGAKKAKHYIGTPFDWTFDFNDDSKLCCTELVYDIYKETLDLSLHSVKHLPRKHAFFLPDDFFDHGFRVAWVSPGVSAVWMRQGAN